MRFSRLGPWFPALLLCSCLTAGEGPPPRGAAGFTVSPSPVTLGAPLRTRDGYTIYVERFVINLSPSTTNDSQRKLFAVTGPVDVFVRAVPEGNVSLRLTLGSGVPFRDSDSVGISGPERERFEAVPNAARDGGVSPFRQFPSLLLVARAEGNGRTYTIDVTLSAVDVEGATREVAVRRDAVTLLPAALRAEELFAIGGVSFAPGVRVTPKEGFVSFQSFANADADGDGKLTAFELGAAQPSTEEQDDAKDHLSGPVVNLAELLVARTMRLLAY
jgi:hypothetical protein